MKFGVFDHVDRSDLPLPEFFEQRLALVRHYDAAGFYGYHIAEHHGTPLGMASSPGLFLSIVAQQTRRLRFGPLVYLLPLYHPIRLAEEIAMLDQLSHGRLDVGVGRGRSPIEVASFGVDPANSQELFDETLDLVLQALTNGRVDAPGAHYQLSNACLAIEPYQRPHPPLWYGIGSPDGVEHCVARGFNAVTLAKPAVAAEICRRYLSAAADAGKDLLMGICRLVVVAPTSAEALATARRAYPYWHRSFNYLFALHGISSSLGWPSDFDAMVEAGLAIAGSPSNVSSAVGAQLAQSGANYFVGQFVFGDMDLAESQRSVDLFVEHVIPTVEGQLAPA